MKNSSNWKSPLKTFGLVLALGLTTASAFGQYKVLHVFTGGSGGGNPYDTPIFIGSTLYGTTRIGGTDGYGTVFSVGTNGQNFTVLQSFAGPNNSAGAYPCSSLIEFDGALYGTATGGGVINGAPFAFGSVYTLQPSGAGFEPFYSFADDNDGTAPLGNVIESGGSGIFYGTTSAGGDGGGGGGSGLGTVFALNAADRTLTTLFTFPQSGEDGASPTAGLNLSGSTLYGTTQGGYVNGILVNGTVFGISTDGSVFSLLHTFTNTRPNREQLGTNSDGASPVCALVRYGDTLYGTAAEGGLKGWGTIFSVKTDGTGFTVLHTFNGTSDGGLPMAGLREVLSNGTLTLYGTASRGGAYTRGTLFSLKTDGTDFKVLHSFAGGTDGKEGAYPRSAPNFYDNFLYGTTQGSVNGGSEGYGVVYRYKLP